MVQIVQKIKMSKMNQIVQMVKNGQQRITMKNNEQQL